MLKNKKELGIENSCEICEKSREIPGNEVLVCEKHGLVKRSGLCRRFVLDPMRINPTLKNRPVDSFLQLDFNTNPII